MDHIFPVARKRALDCVVRMARTLHLDYSHKVARGFSLDFVGPLARSSRMDFSCPVARVNGMGFNDVVARKLRVDYVVVLARVVPMGLDRRVGSQPFDGFRFAGGSHNAPGLQDRGGSHGAGGVREVFGSHFVCGLQWYNGLRVASTRGTQVVPPSPGDHSPAPPLGERTALVAIPARPARRRVIHGRSRPSTGRSPAAARRPSRRT